MVADRQSSNPRGKGGKGRGGSRLGMKTTIPPTTPVPTAPDPPASSPSPPPPPSSNFHMPLSTADSSVSPAVPGCYPVPAHAQGAAVPLRPSQGPGFGSMTSNFPSQEGNQQSPNLWAFYPPGGFMNYLQRSQLPPQPHMRGEDFHLVGQSMSFNPISPPPPPSAYGAVPSKPVHIEIDEGENGEEDRPARKRYWTHDEEERLASAWLNASKDPVKGNDKKFDTFWREVTNAFNKKGDGKRIREMNQLKVHWSRLKTSINDFNDAHTKATQRHTSGYDDDMLEEEAQKIYESRFRKRFQLVHWWKKLKDEPKWLAQFQDSEKDNSEILDIPEEQLRPIGRQAAKEAAKAERSGKKRKNDDVKEGMDVLGENIDKIIKVQEDRKAECQKAAEAQILISNANLKAAQEQKEAKMFEVYNSLLNQDTSQMTDDQKANRDKAICKLQEKLFPD